VRGGTTINIYCRQLAEAYHRTVSKDRLKAPILKYSQQRRFVKGSFLFGGRFVAPKDFNVVGRANRIEEILESAFGSDKNANGVR